MSDPGLFDLLNPVLGSLDYLLGHQLGLPALGRIAVYAAIGGALSMFIYRYLSNQTLIAQLKTEIRDVQGALADTDLQPGQLRSAIRNNLRLTGRQLFLSFWPALLASVPIVFLLAFCSNQFAFTTPVTGERFYVAPVGMQDSPADYSWKGGNAQWDARKQAWTFYYPAKTQSLALNFGDETQLQLPASIASGVIHKKLWWNWLLANPAGYLPENARIDQFDFSTSPQIIIDWGPGWMRGWLFAFIVFLLGVSLAIKWFWKIH